jgi:ferredoxin
MSMYRIEIDRSLCSGFGSCVREASAVLALDDEGLATTLVGETDDASVLDAAASCPMGAITVLETRSGAQAA